MTDLVRFDRDALHEFVQRMRLIADDLEDAYEQASQACGGDDAGRLKRRYGVQVVLGTGHERHEAVDAGEQLALRISEGLSLTDSVAATIRELSAKVWEIQRNLDATDVIAGEDVDRIVDGRVGVMSQGVDPVV